MTLLKIEEDLNLISLTAKKKTKNRINNQITLNTRKKIKFQFYFKI